MTNTYPWLHFDVEHKAGAIFLCRDGEQIRLAFLCPIALFCKIRLTSSSEKENVLKMLIYIV